MAKQSIFYEEIATAGFASLAMTAYRVHPKK